MAVEFAGVDAAYPYVCAVYRCKCGATAIRHGQDAGAPPPRWEIEHQGDPRWEQAVCPRCASLSAGLSAS